MKENKESTLSECFDCAYNVDNTCIYRHTGKCSKYSYKWWNDSRSALP